MQNKILPFLLPFLIWLPPMASADGCQGDENERNQLTSVPWMIAEDKPFSPHGTGGHDELRDQLEGLMDELKRLEKDVRGKIQEEMIPLIRRQIERIKKWLQELRHDEDPQEPVMTRFKDKDPLTPTPIG